ncbi:MAG: UvrD-helicase domain-containing protein [Planctomycetota bacterium]|nr:UvrD-helicase domain-containing protein [Planctomycetota bacterium]
MKLPPQLESSVLLASAGTGKTFQLSNRYLGLVLHGAPVEEILASTFTRKAAGEILDSILGRLAKACADSASRKELAGFLGVEDEWSQAEAVALLRTLLRRLPQLQVGTLDSWFQKQVGAAALDLGLPFGWRLADFMDLKDLHQRAVEQSLADLPPRQTSELLASLQSGHPGRSVLHKTEEELDLAAKCWEACAYDPAAWELLSGVRPPTEEAMQQVCAILREYPVPTTANGGPHKNWTKAMARSIELAEAGDWKALMVGGFMEKLAAGEEKYDRKEIETTMLRPVLEVAARAILYDFHLGTCAMRDLTARYAENRTALQEQSCLLSFDDFPKRLAQCAPEDRTRFMQRLGVPAKHLLLDEFQDTSVGQWQALEQPAREAVQSEQKDGSGSLFVVGDDKQSIYGFREGEPRLLHGLSKWYDIASAEMAVNYRSTQTVLDAVNQTFLGLADNYDCGESTVLSLGLEAWREYPKHLAHSAKEGVVRVIEANGKNPDNNTDTEATILRRTEDLYRKNPEHRIGVLVHNNKSVARLLAQFTALSIPACAAGGNPLVDAHAVDVALSMFQLADHPEDTEAWFHIATSPLAEFWKVAFTPGKSVRIDAMKLSRRLRKRLLQDGYGDLLHKMHQHFCETKAFDPWNLQRFGQLVELGRSWDARSDLRPSRFRDMVQEQRVASKATGQVEVMTVHQSKGLDFDAVVVWVKDKRGRRDAFFAGRPDPRKPATGVGRNPTETTLLLAEHLKETDFLEAYYTQEASALHEMLCVLYVSMTRAKSHMELILPKPAAKPKYQRDWIRAADIVRRMLVTTSSPAEVPEAENFDPWRIVWQTHDFEPSLAPRQTDPLPGAEKNAGAQNLEAIQGPLFAKSRNTRSLPRWTPSSAAKQGGVIAAASLFADASGFARRRGTAIHRLFEDVIWLEDYALDTAARKMSLLQLDPAPSAEELEPWLKDFDASVTKKGVVEALSKPNNLPTDVELEVLRERPFAVKTIDSHGAVVILQGIYDRVILHRRNGKVISADVIDFKTGAAPPDGVIPETYQLQLDAYRRALCVQHNIEAADVSCKLLFVDSGDLI